jgi:hypothetical protein
MPSKICSRIHLELSLEEVSFSGGRVQPTNPSLVCEVCGARVFTLRRGRCWICYVRWAESRPVGLGAACVICNDRRQDNLRMVEFQGSWMPMCHNCGTKSLRLTPMPHSLEGVKERLVRDRRWSDRRHEKPDYRLLPKERRVGERRVSMEELGIDWVDAGDLIIEVIDVSETDEAACEATRILPSEAVEQRPLF